MRKFLNILIVLLALAMIIIIIGKIPEWYKTQQTTKEILLASSNEKQERLEKKVKEIKNFITKKEKYNQHIAFLIDMKIPSEKYRFVVYDLQKDSVLEQGIVAHGIGSETGIHGQLKFSNIPNSKATSLGKYAIGNSYIGQFGKAYKLHGLDTSNNKAFERYVVLHQYHMVPYEQKNYPIIRSEGCPMVSNKFFKTLEKYIDTADKKILLDIYY